MKTCVLAGVASLAVSGLASAGFVGYVLETNVIGDNTVFQLFGQFDNTTDVVVNVGNFAGGAGLNYFHSDLQTFLGNAGSWNANDSIGAFGNPAIDSYVLIGGLVGGGNSTSADPGFGAPGFNQAGIPDGAGWFNSNPPNMNGLVNGEGRVFLGQFSFLTSALPTVAATISLDIFFNANESGSGTFVIVPAPGALALLGLAGLVGRRRRA